MSRDLKDILGGSLLLLFGAAWSWYSLTHYELGTVNQMGSGMFPTALGIILAFFGAIVLVTGFVRTGEFPEIKVRTPIAILASIGAFALLVQPFGLFPAVAALTIISSLGDKAARPLPVLGLTAFLGLLTWLVFGVALRLTVPIFNWPF